MWECQILILSRGHEHIRISARRCIGADPGAGEGKVRITCITPEYRKNEAEMWNHREAELQSLKK